MEIMKQEIITSSSASGLNKKIAEMQGDGWEPLGSHQVVTTLIRNVVRGDGVINRSDYSHEYSQTMVKK
jgi:hypothetical protein